MKKLIHFTILYCLLFSFSCFSQVSKEGNWWYFGQNAGIDFNSGSPVVQLNGQLNSFEATSVVADAAGNLLFYTDGVRVWNKNHAVMTNGTGLLGNQSTSQGAIIIKHSTLPNIYYIYTQDAIQNNLANGLRFSVVDMSLNGGLGAVTEKNTFVVPNATEKMTAVRQANGQNLWLLNATWNQPTINTITTGSMPTVTPNTVDFIHQGSINIARGCMKASPDGKWLAMAYFNNNLPYSLSLYSFDNATGKPTFVQGFTPTATALGITTNIGSYGVEFSPDNSKLYFTANAGAGFAALYQVDLTKKPFVANAIARHDLSFLGSLQIAPDGKIYCGVDNALALGVISNPNASGTAANWNINGLNLSGRRSTRSLPSFPQNIFLPTFQADFTITQGICPNTSSTFTATITPSRTDLTYTWEFGDGKTTNGTFATANTVQNTYEKAGTYQVSLTVRDAKGFGQTIIKTLVLKDLTIDAGTDKIVCANDSVQVGLPAQAGLKYSWKPTQNFRNPNIAQPFFKATAQDFGKKITCYLEVQNTDGGLCKAIDSMVVTVNPQILAEAGEDKIVCSNEMTVLGGKTSNPNFTYSWQPTTALSNATIANPTFQKLNSSNIDEKITYIVTVTDKTSSCKNADTVIVTLRPTFTVNLGEDKKMCFDAKPLQIGVSPVSSTTYSWSPTANLSNATIANPIFTVPTTITQTQNLTYILAATKDNCTVRDTLQLTIYPQPDSTKITGKNVLCPFEQNIEYVAELKQGYTYRWLVSGGTIASQDNNKIRVNWNGANATARVRVIPITEFGCQKDTFNLNVIINAVQKLEKPTGVTQICFLEAKNMAYQVIAKPNYTYSWAVTGGKITSGQGTNRILVAWDSAGIGIIQATELSTNLGVTCRAISDTLGVRILPSPKTSRILGDTAICEKTLQKIYTVSPINLTSKYEWKVLQGTTVLQTGIGTSLTTDWKIAGNYVIEVTETLQNACVGLPNRQNITVFALPKPEIEGTKLVCPSTLNNVKYNVKVSASNQNSKYSWRVTGGTVIGADSLATVTVNWQNNNSPKQISLVETNVNNCKSEIVTQNIDFDNVSLNLNVVSVGENDENSFVLNFASNNNSNTNNTIRILQREISPTQQTDFQTLGTVAKTATTFSTTTLPTNSKVFDFKIEITNSCNEILSANLHNNILLKATKTENVEQPNLSKINLVWNEYKGWQQVNRYEIWRKVDDETTYKLLTTSNIAQIELLNALDGFKHCFRIKAIDANSNVVSWSNSICVDFVHELWVPNVITPNGDGKNDVFDIRNITLYKDSEIEIYNRYGVKVYESRNYQNNWNGENAPAGLYYYTLRSAEKRKEYKGWVQILKE